MATTTPLADLLAAQVQLIQQQDLQAQQRTQARIQRIRSLLSDLKAINATT
jgi:hypothetical protein